MKHAEIRKVTPEMAEDYLKRNHNNRNISEQQVRYYAQQMTAGEWVYDAQPIRFSKTGMLLDGQHRLNAIIKSKTTQEFLIASDIEPEAFKVMDTGKIRSATDAFGIEGVDNHREVAKITKVIWLHSKERYYKPSHEHRPTHQQLIDFYRKNKDIDDYVIKAKHLCKQFDRILPISILGGLYYLTSKKNVEAAEDFWEKLTSGVGMEKESAILYLRRFLEKDKMSESRYPSTIKNYVIYYCWHEYRKGNSVTKVDLSKWQDYPELI